MAPQTGTAVLVLAAFVLPGFVTALIRDRTYHVRSRAEPGELVLAALYYSGLIYIIAAAVGVFAGFVTDFGADDVVGLYRGHGTLAEYTGLAVAGLVVGPVVVAVCGKVWVDSRLRAHTFRWLDIDPAHGTRSGWEHWFAQRRPCLIRATLADGRIVGGFMATGKSFAGFSVHSQDLFIEQRWELDDDGWFLRPADDSLGVYLR